MSGKFKTSKKKRSDYIYYTSEGKKIVITPGEDGVTEADIELLHSMDDLELDKQRRYEYRVDTHLDSYFDGENESANDRNKYLADNSMNPEETLISAEEKQEFQTLIKDLPNAIEKLLPQQKELIDEFYYKDFKIDDLAEKYGVTHVAIIDRLKRIYKNLEKNLK